MKRKWLYTLIALLALSCSSNKNDQPWPQFRGVNGAGVASNTSKPPITFGDQNLKWETEIPNGVSSPIIRVC
jgi:outer membrane protein assembly factor BamB